MNYILVILVCAALFSTTSSDLLKDDEVTNFVKSHGYMCTAHEVVTEDGYVLRLHRIPPRFNKGPKKPVFLMHSAFSNSLYYLNTPNISLGFYFADEGYDVYLGNVRGSKYSTAHKWLNTESLDYWRFSFHEMGVYDLPALIDYTLKVSGSDKVYYVGHSQATTQELVFLSMRPEYNRKIIQSHLMSTAGAFANPRFPVKQLAPLYLVFAKMLNNLPYINFEPGNKFGTRTSNVLCTKGLPLRFCQLFNFLFLGGDPRMPFMPNTDPAIYRTIFPTLSPRTGIQQVTHYAQTMITGKFRPFDYGPEKNLKLYGAKVPPDYPLHKITSPVYLYVGQYDIIFRKMDTDLVARQLPNVHYMIIPSYNHIDFVFARNARDKIYNIILHAFEEANLSRRLK
ncbi:hypothetical protein ACKWTF_000920 [Chironomus riparius]